MAQVDKLMLAAEAIRHLPRLVRASGVYRPAQPTSPATWWLETSQWRISLAENVLLAEADAALSMLLDVWPVRGTKVLSISWMPEQPWIPPRVIQCKAGAWQELLRADAVP